MNNFEKSLGYKFNNIHLLEKAITHSSYANEKKRESNERLEFLGDSVLSLVVSDYIFKNMPHIDEGKLTKIRASLVCEQSLAVLARKVRVGEYILLGKGEEMTGGRERASILSDAYEAIIAAIYLDSDVKVIREWLLGHMSDELENALAGVITKDYKTMLQEAVQKGDRGKVTYKTVKETGPDHNKYFEVEVMIDDDVINTGIGQSKKEAEQHAAKVALDSLKNENL